MLGLEMLSFNVDDGFPEAICRALRKGFIKEDTYSQLKSCSNLAEFKLVLEDTDYSTYIAAEANPIDTTVLQRRMKEKLMNEINYMISLSSQPLTGFLQMMLHSYQIDNVVDIIEALKRTDYKLDDAIQGADPLGFFPELNQVKSAEGDDYVTLYQSVLIDLPIGSYFRKFLDDIMAAMGSDDKSNQIKRDAKFISELLKDFKAEKIKNMLKQIWLNDFYNYCMKNLTDVSKEIMEDLLKFESDLMTIQIIFNSFGMKDLSSASGKESERKKYISNLGYLYPGRDKELTSADSFDKLKEAVKGFHYEDMLAGVTDTSSKEERGHEISSQGKSIDDVMFIERARKLSQAFENQFHYGVFYSYLKMKELEIKNVIWLTDLVSLNIPRQLPGWNKVIIPFKYHKDEIGQAGAQ